MHIIILYFFIYNIIFLSNGLIFDPHTCLFILEFRIDVWMRVVPLSSRVQEVLERGGTEDWGSDANIFPSH